MATKKVFVTRRIPRVLERLAKVPGLEVRSYGQLDHAIPRADLLNGVRGCDGLYCLLTDNIDESVLEAAGSQLKVVSTMSVGYNHVDVEACQKRKIAVGYTPGVLSRTTAETAVALVFATMRKVVDCASKARAGEWGVWQPYQYCGSDVFGSTVGLVGLGRIGKEFARMMSGFHCKFLYTGPREKPKDAAEIQATYCSFDELLKKSDIVSIHCPLNEETRHLFNEAAFKKMKKNAYLINTSRGPVVDQDALCAALQSGGIAGAGLDVTDPEPLDPSHKIPSAVILPHIGSATTATRNEMADLALNNLLAALDLKEDIEGDTHFV